MSLRDEWKRLNGSHRTRDVRKGLQARIADPLWMLCRQWQFGEFQGEDAASPVKVEMGHVSLPVNELQLYGPLGDPGETQALTDDDLLEAAVEREAISTGPAALRARAEAGVQFLRRLPKGARVDAREHLQEHFPLAARRKVPLGGERFVKTLVAGSFDAAAFRTAEPAAIAALAQAVGADLGAVRDVFDAWAAYYDRRFFEPDGAGSWQNERLEYRFAAAANHGGKVIVGLEAGEYAGGRLDWYSVNHRSDASDETVTLQDPEPLWLIPTPVRYAGMPADRFWDFEDGEVFFAGLTAQDTDLAQLIVTEFATVYSNDWYMLPLPVPVGSLTRVTSLKVVDTFGETHLVRPAAEEDGEDRVWRFFELSGDSSAEDGFSPWLYVPRTLLGGHEGPPVEKVVFTRDEMANLAWGIEEHIEGQSGHQVSRRTQWARHRDQVAAYLGSEDAEATGEPGADPPWVYRLLTMVPPFWVPFTPEVGEDQRPTNRLLRGRMAEWDLLGDLKRELAGGQGLLLQPDGPMALQEQEIPRGAVEVTRSYQAARDPAGRLVLWAARRKRPSSGNRSSGRETDQIEDVT